MNFQAAYLGLRTERSQTQFNMDTLKLKKKKKVLLLQQQHDVNTRLFGREGRPTNGLRRCYGRLGQGCGIPGRATGYPLLREH